MKLNTEGDTMADLVTVNKILEKSLGTVSDDKNIIFLFLLETTYLTNYSEIFAHDLIIDNQSNGHQNCIYSCKIQLTTSNFEP